MRGWNIVLWLVCIYSQEKKAKAVKQKEGGNEVKPAQGMQAEGKEESVTLPGEKEHLHELPTSSTETTNKATPTAIETTPTANETTPAETESLPEEEDPITVASRLRWQRETKSTSTEKTFSSLSISRTLYTLSAVLPQDMSVRNTHTPFAGL